MQHKLRYMRFNEPINVSVNSYEYKQLDRSRESELEIKWFIA